MYRILFVSLICIPFHSSAQLGNLYRVNPFPHQYFIAPASYDIPKHRNVYQNGMGLLNQLTYNFKNGRAAGIGFVPTFLFGGHTDYVPMWVTARVNRSLGYKRPTIHLSSIMIDLPKSADGDAGAIFAGISWGTKDRNFTFGGGYYFGTGDSETDEGLFGPTLHGMTRLGKKSWLITENYILCNKNNIAPLSISGARFRLGKCALDLGAIYFKPTYEMSDFIEKQHVILPWLSFHCFFINKASYIPD